MENKSDLFAALAVAQGQFEPVKTDQKVDFTTKAGGKVKYNYASFAAIMKMAQKPLSENGLSVFQITKDDTLITILAHQSGQSITSSIPLPNTNDIKQLGANLSYLRRYQYTAIIGAVVLDEDNEKAVEGTVRPQPTRKPLPPEKLLAKLDTTMKAKPYIDGDTGEALPISVHALGEDTAKLVAKKWAEALGGDVDGYHLSLMASFGQNSAKDLTAGQGNAALSWLLGSQKWGFDTPVVEPVPEEAKGLLAWAKQQKEEAE